MKITIQNCISLLYTNCIWLIILYILKLRDFWFCYIDLYIINRSVQCEKNEEVFEIDKANWSDFMYVGCYAREIFKYLKQREVRYSFY